MRTTSARFEVSYPDYGVIEHVPSKREAETVARNFCANNGLNFVEVYDRMARAGGPELYRVDKDGNFFVVRRRETWAEVLS